MDRIDKQLEATAKLVRAGIKLVTEERKLQAEERKRQAEYWARQKEADETFNYKLNALIESQQRTDAKLDRLIDTLHRGNGNGRKSS